MKSLTMCVYTFVCCCLAHIFGSLLQGVADRKIGKLVT